MFIGHKLYRGQLQQQQQQQLEQDQGEQAAEAWHSMISLLQGQDTMTGHVQGVVVGLSSNVLALIICCCPCAAASLRMPDLANKAVLDS